MHLSTGLRDVKEPYAPMVEAWVWVLYDNAGHSPVLMDWSEKS